MRSLEADLRSSATVNGKLQQQLTEEKDKGERETRKIKHFNQDLEAQVCMAYQQEYTFRLVQTQRSLVKPPLV